MLRYAGPFLFLGAIPALYYGVGPSAPLLSVVALLAALTGAELVAPRDDGPDAGPGPGGFRTLVLAYIPLQILTTAWAIWLSPYLSAWGLVALAISLGVTTGVFGVLAAHEAAHSGERCAALLGAALLTMMSYRHFRVAHLHGHHRFAATALDRRPRDWAKGSTASCCARCSARSVKRGCSSAGAAGGAIVCSATWG